MAQISTKFLLISAWNSVILQGPTRGLKRVMYSLPKRSFSSSDATRENGSQILTLICVQQEHHALYGGPHHSQLYAHQLGSLPLCSPAVPCKCHSTHIPRLFDMLSHQFCSYQFATATVMLCHKLVPISRLERTIIYSPSYVWIWLIQARFSWP